MTDGTLERRGEHQVIRFALDTDIHGRLRWELEPAGDGTVLTFTAEVELPKDTRAR